MKAKTLLKLEYGILTGAAGGIAGALAMHAARRIAQKMGLLRTPLPLKVERRLEEKVRLAHKTNKDQEKALAFGEHLLVGAMFGAAFGAMRSGFEFPPLPSGPLFGLGVYALSVAGIGPALHLARGPWDQNLETVQRRLLVHLLYGTVLGVAVNRMDRMTGQSG
jgi:NAD(P)-dependent dehydrogenase (short-subunit alcohol dehydrogenase family)